MTNHIVLIKQDSTGKPTAWRYVKSHFPRELGDTMTFDGVRMKVGIMGGNRPAVIKAAKGIFNKIKAQADAAEKKEFAELILSILNNK